jgi:hypothetical protein
MIDIVVEDMDLQVQEKAKKGRQQGSIKEAA